MEPLKIEGATKTPEVFFDTHSGEFTIKGMSYPEYGKEFYTPVLEWLDEYAKQPLRRTVVNIQFKYFNTSSAKSILSLLQKLNDIRAQGNEVIINWYFEKNDEQMVQDGENYSTLLDFPFNIKEL